MIAALASPEPHPWHELERGEISLAAYIDYVESKVPGAGVLFDASTSDNVMGSLELVQERIGVVRAVREQGLRVGLCTNNVAEWQQYWLPRLPVDLFEIVIDSAAVGHRKPEPAIYELALTMFDIADPSTVLFIDDFEWNVQGAVDVGMVGLHCPADLDLRAALKNMAVLND